MAKLARYAETGAGDVTRMTGEPTRRLRIGDYGEQLVVLSLREYESLLARAGDEAAEDAMTRRIVAESDAAIARGEDIALPIDVWEEIESGSPVRALRKYRGITQRELAAKAGIRQAFLSDIEAGKKTVSPDTLKAIASALAVPLTVLSD
jgi:ribosome-binding protein aMBF1 (putative translation factor)